MNDVQEQLRTFFEEEAARAILPEGLYGDVQRSAKTRRITSVALAVGAVATVALCVVLTAGRLLPERTSMPPAGGLSTETAPTPRPSEGFNGETVWDGKVGFQLIRLDCGGNDVGDEDSQLLATGKFCMAMFNVTNATESEVTLPLDGHILVGEGEAFETWPSGMRELAFDDAGTPFVEPIPPGGGAVASALFELPRHVQPQSLRLLAQTGSPGALIRLDRCQWNTYRGSVTGGCYSPPDGLEVGVERAHSISTYTGSERRLFQVTCFGGIEWEVVSHPVEPVPEGFVGQGTIVLLDRDRARFQDNSGITLSLAPTGRNQTDSSICG